MDNIKEKIKKFIIYEKNYTKLNVAFFVIVMTCIALMSAKSYMFKNIAGYIMLLLPFAIPLFIEDKDGVAENKNKSTLIISIKHYTIKYLKIFAVFLILFTTAGVLALISSWLLEVIRFDKMGLTLGSSALFIAIAFIGIEGCKILISDLPAAIVYVIKYEDYTVLESVKHGRLFMKQGLFDYIFSIALTGLLLIPIVMLSALIQVYLISAMLKLVYLMIWFEYVAFDLKERITIFSKEEIVIKNNNWKPGWLFGKK